ncbi:MAG: membrane protein insertase YidC, partial [Terriglobales bacterium]
AGAPATQAAAAARRLPPPVAHAVAAHQAQTLRLETPVFAITFLNRGAVAENWVLRKYTDNHGHPLNVVNEPFSAEHGYPLAFWTPDAKLNATLDQALFTMAETHPRAGETVVRFAWSNGSLAASKQLSFQNGYVVDVRARLTRNGAPVPGAAIAWPGDFGDLSVSDHYSQLKTFEAPANGKISTTGSSKVSNGGSSQQDFAFAGLQDLYFAAAFLPAHGGQQTVTTFNTAFQPAGGKAEHVAGMAFRTGAVNEFRLFVGPKDIALLNHINPRLGELVDFGIFSILAHPIFLWMKWTYQHWIHNYGWVIIFITFVITMAMFPFRWKAQKTSIKMAALAPKIKALNDKMKKFPMRDPRRQGVQQEIMKVYQDNGVNPLGGCLPMLVPVILIWAFYEVLEVAIALRHAPWVGYIHDLSAMDPYYILPIVLVISQFWTMNLMPMTPGADPKQMKLMKWVMPLGLGYIFFFLPSGVNLYYLASNFISVGQQLLINKHFGYSPGKPQGRSGPEAGRLDASGKPVKARLAPAN